MSLPTAGDLASLDYAFGATPFAPTAPGTDTKGLDFSFGGTPFLAAPSAAGGVTPLGTATLSVSIAGVADLKLGTTLSGTAPAGITGAADLQTGTHLYAVGHIEATPRGRLAGAPAAPGAGNFFLLF